MRSLVRATAAVMACAGVGVVAPAAAQDAKSLRTRALVATCAHCHGTDGQAVGAELTRLAGLPKAHLMAQLEAFRAGQRPATVMHQIAKGFTPEQLDEIATYLADPPR